MKLYYGAGKIIKQPTYGLGNPSNDYGLGFYLTPSKEAAFLWASRFKNGKVMTYAVGIENLKVLKLNNDTETDILRWIALLSKNRFDSQERIRYKEVIEWLVRKFPVNLSDYDIVIGYRADDSYFAYSAGFVAGDISIETLSQAMLIGKLALQYVLISPKAFQFISYLKCEEVESQYSYDSFRKKALEDYHELKRNEDRFANHFIGDIMRKYGK